MNLDSGVAAGSMEDLPLVHIIHVTARCIIFLYLTSSQSLNAAAIVSDLVVNQFPPPLPRYRFELVTCSCTSQRIMMSNTGF